MASIMHCFENSASLVATFLKPFGFAAVRVPFTIIGFIAVAATVFYIAIGVLRGMLKYFIPRYVLPLGVNFRKIQGWTVITGATDGIGKEFALQLAAMGKDIVLVARNPQKLAAVAREIKQQSPDVKTAIVVADFTGAGDLQFFERIRQELGSLDIGILINNVGIMVDAFFPFLDNKLQLDLDQFHININSTVFMTRMLLPQMLKRGKNKPSLIINLASFVGILDPPMVYLNLYPSTKAFLRYFTNALALEYKNSGVTFQTVAPGLVRTNMGSKFAKDWLRFGLYISGVSVQSYVRWTLTNIGLANETSGHPFHAFQSHLVTHWFPDWVPSSFIGRLSMIVQKRAQLQANSSSQTQKEK